MVYGASYLDDEYEGEDHSRYYSIIDIKEGSNKLVKIRNTYGVIDWREWPWGIGSSEWESYPDMNEMCDPKDDDTFWISFEDFYTNFFGISCTKIDEWNEIWLPGKFIRVKDAQDTSNNMVLSNYYYEVNFPTDSNVYLGIHQENPLTVGAELRQ